jgi:hypothetical protein
MYHDRNISLNYLPASKRLNPARNDLRFFSILRKHSDGNLFDYFNFYFLFGSGFDLKIENIGYQLSIKNLIKILAI